VKPIATRIPSDLGVRALKLARELRYFCDAFESCERPPNTLEELHEARKAIGELESATFNLRNRLDLWRVHYRSGT
jgi:hypothetical protein